jgi:hypothetical protein
VGDECDTLGGRRGAFRDGNSEADIKDIEREDLDSLNLVRYMNKWQAVVNINRRVS